jgi:hypothetical protein
MSLPNTGDSNWGIPLNDYITTVVLAQANTAAAAITTHQAASDPHGDRAYALGLVSPLTSGINGPNGLLQLDGTGRIPTSALPTGGGRTNTFDVVADYSAPTNGTAAATAIQSALNDAGTDGGGEVWVGDGTFGIDLPLYVPSGVWLHLSPGATMNRIVNGGSGLAPSVMVANFSGSVSSTGASNVTIDGGSWIFDGQSAVGFPMAFAGGTNVIVKNASIRTLKASAAVVFAGCTDSGTRNCQFSTSGSLGSRASYSSANAAVDIEPAVSAAISGLNSAMYTSSPCTGIFVQGCSITGATASDGTGLYTAFDGLAGTNNTVASTFHTGIIITGNTAVALPTNGVYPANWQTATITSNQLGINDGSTASTTWNPSQPAGANVVVANNGTSDGTSAGLYAYKSSNTSRSNTTTLTIDPALQVTVVANGVYEMRAVAIYSCTVTGATPGFAYDIQLPSGSLEYSVINPLNTSLEDEGYVDTAGTPDWVIVASGTYLLSQEMKGILTVGATGGTVGLKWAQHLTSATAMTVCSGSYIVLTRLA